MERPGSPDLRHLSVWDDDPPAAVATGEEPSDAALIAQILDGSINTFESLLHRYRAFVWTITSRQVPESVVPDLTQEIFLEAYRSLARYDGRKPFKNWLVGITLHRCRDHWRRVYRRREIPMSSLGEEHHQWLDNRAADQHDRVFPGLIDQREAREILDHALAGLSPKDRQVLTLVYLEELPVKEVALMLGWSAINVKVRAYRARMKMRTSLGALLNKEKHT